MARTQPSQPTPKKSKSDIEAGLSGAFTGSRAGGPIPFAKKGAKTGGRIGTNTNLTTRSTPAVGKRIDSIPRPKAAPKKR